MTLNKIVQVFYTGENGTNEYQKIDYSSITDILYSFIRVNGDGTLGGYDYGDPSNLIAYAHNKGVRVHLSFQQKFGEADQLLGNPTARTNAIKNLLAEVKAKGFDGIDNDIETYSADQDDMTAFVKELYTTFKSSNSNYRVSANAHIVNAGNVFNGQAIRDYVDYLMIMAYDVCSTDATQSGPVAPMDNPDHACYGTSVNQGINYWKNVIPTNKLLLGIPYYGLIYKTSSSTRLSSGSFQSWFNIDNVPNYNYTRNFDPSWETPWQVWQSGGWHQLQYDDIQSLGIKYDAVISNNFAGIGIWAIDYALNGQTTWLSSLAQLIKDKFSGGPVQKYRCTDAPNYQCVEDPNGPYNSLTECQAACKVPVTKYRCTGAPNYQCVEDPNGPYNSLTECQAACKVPTKKYRCTGAPNYQCVEDPNGPYNSLAECQATCKVPTKKYRCTGAPNYQCVEDPNGPYNSLAECQAACKPSEKKFKINAIGSQGVLVMKSSRGDHTADDACKEACNIIKEIN